jgi:hypothetical protein
MGKVIEEVGFQMGRGEEGEHRKWNLRVLDHCRVYPILPFRHTTMYAYTLVHKDVFLIS